MPSTEDPSGNQDLESIRSELERVLSEIRHRRESLTDEVRDEVESRRLDAVLAEAEALALAGFVYVDVYQQETAEDCLHQASELYRTGNITPTVPGQSIAAVDKRRVIERRQSFLRALEENNPAVLQALYAIHHMHLEESAEISEVDRWMDSYNFRADWMREAAVNLLRRLRLNSSVEHGPALKVSFEAEWEPPFIFECRSYNPAFESRKTAEKRINELFSAALKLHLDDGDNPTNAKRERSRDKRPPDVRFKWLAMSLTRSETFRSIAEREKVDFSNISRGIDRAREELGFPPDDRGRGRPRAENT